MVLRSHWEQENAAPNAAHAAASSVWHPVRSNNNGATAMISARTAPCAQRHTDGLFHAAPRKSSSLASRSANVPRRAHSELFNPGTPESPGALKPLAGFVAGGSLLVAVNASVAAPHAPPHPGASTAPAHHVAFGGPHTARSAREVPVWALPGAAVPSASELHPQSTGSTHRSPSHSASHSTSHSASPHRPDRTAGGLAAATRLGSGRGAASSGDCSPCEARDVEALDWQMEVDIWETDGAGLPHEWPGPGGCGAVRWGAAEGGAARQLVQWRESSGYEEEEKEEAEREERGRGAGSAVAVPAARALACG